LVTGFLCIHPLSLAEVEKPNYAVLLLTARERRILPSRPKLTHQVHVRHLRKECKTLRFAKLEELRFKIRLQLGQSGFTQIPLFRVI
jgi:hypothetical protein